MDPDVGDPGLGQRPAGHPARAHYLPVGSDGDASEGDDTQDGTPATLPVVSIRQPAPGGDMATPYILFADLAAEAPIPARGILSQTLSDEGDIEFLLFAFAAGEQLSEHTSARPAIIHIPAGEGLLTVGGDAHSARPGTWLRMGPDVKHSLVARTPMQMALYLLPRQQRVPSLR